MWRFVDSDGGVVYFYQCEFPYCVDTSFGEEDFRGYIVNDAVKSHAVFAPGIYSNFRNDNVRVKTAIEMPIGEAFVCLNPFTVKLDNQGGIESVLNGKGGCTTATGEPVRLVERHSNETETNT